MAVARNAPCPCGSGLKYKRCCLGAEETSAGGTRNGPLVLVVVGLAAALVVGSAVGLRSGGAVAVGSILAGALWAVFRNPPPPSQGGNSPAGLNFGR